MEEKEIYNLIERFEASSLTALKIQDGEFCIQMEKGGVTAAQPPARPMAQPSPSVSTPQGETGDPKAAPSNYRQVKSPIVGIYYAAASPQQAPFVKIGQKVEKGQVLCLVEAMKMMNELKAPVDGIIRTIGGINGELVEFDQVLFEVEPC